MQSASFGSFAVYRTAALACGVFFAAGLTLAALGPSLPVLATRSGVDVATLGGLFTAFSLGVMLAQVGVVQAKRRWGQRATLALSALLMGLSSLTLAQSGSVIPMFAAALGGGVGFGGVLAMGNTLVAQLFPARSAAALNALNLFFGLGAIGGPMLAAAANARLGAPQLALALGAGALAAFAPAVARLAVQSTAMATQQPGSIPATAPTRPLLLGLLLLVYSGCEIGFGAWLTLYTSQSTQLDAAQAALVTSSFWLALTGGRGLAVALGVRLPAPALLRLCLAGILFGVALLALGVGNLVLTCAGVLCFGLSCGPVFPTVMALATGSAQGDRATSRVLLLGNCGGIIVPALLGLALTRIGPWAVAAVLLAAAIVMLGLGIAAVRPQQALVAPGDADCVAVR
jgi:MFS transporter, FHS family, L-fucose permease